MIRRREFLTLPALAFAPAMKPKERVDAVLAGRKPDRHPFTFWHHFGLQNKPPVQHARATLDFQRQFRLDLVKVMSDFPYPKGNGKAWYELKPVDNPYPAQIEALGIIRDGLAGSKYFVETIFNPWNVAEKLSSPEQVKKLQQDNPQALLNALEAIAKSEAAHAKKSLATGAAGIFLAIANAQEGLMTKAEYQKFSEPFDRMVLEAASGAAMNTLHLHGDKVWIEHFTKGWPASVINWDTVGTGVSVAKVRQQYGGVVMCGVDHRTMKSFIPETAPAAGTKWIAAPGCSVPDDSKDADLLRLSAALSG